MPAYTKHNQKNKALFFSYFVIAAALIFFSQVTTHALAEHGYMQYSVFFLIGGVSSLLLLLNIKKHSVMGFNLIDLSVFIFFIVIIGRSLNTSNHYIYSKGAIAVAILPLYFISKFTKHTRAIHWAIVFNGLIQLLTAILQQVGSLTNINSFFKIGGTFGNPNVLAMVLLISLFSSIYLIGLYKSTKIKYGLIAYSFLSIFVLFSTKCRSAILALMIIFIIHQFYKKNWKNSIKDFYLAVVFIVFQSGAFIYLLITKFDSLTGRILIWKASLLTISEKPIWGHGISSFHKVYPNAQKAFFVQGSNTVYDKIAGSPKWAYNDFIELWLEGGLLLSASFALILLAVIISSRGKKQNRYAFYAVVAFFILGTVNFAYTAWPVLLIFIVNLGVFSSSCANRYSLVLGRRLKYLAASIIVVSMLANTVLAIKSVSTLYFLNEIQTTEKLSIKERSRFFENNTQYSYYPLYAYKYSAQLIRNDQYEKGIEVLQRLNNYNNSYQSNIELAKAYMGANDLVNARAHFNAAVQIVPGNIKPYINLLLIAQTLGNHKTADSINKQIITREFKGNQNYINNMINILMKNEQ